MTRLEDIRQAPFSWKEMDILTGAERFMPGALDLDLIGMILACFPDAQQEYADRISKVWRCSSAALHLRKIYTRVAKVNNDLGHQAAQIYSLEAQRLLGSLFPLQHAFWKVFYARQEQEADQIFVAVDALHEATGCQNQIEYQLILQALKVIVDAHYTAGCSRKYDKALRLIGDLPLPELKSWIISQQLIEFNQI